MVAGRALELFARQLSAPVFQRVERIFDLPEVIERLDLRDQKLARLVDEMVQLLGRNSDTAEGRAVACRRSFGAARAVFNFKLNFRRVLRRGGCGRRSLAGGGPKLVEECVDRGGLVTVNQSGERCADGIDVAVKRF